MSFQIRNEGALIASLRLRACHVDVRGMCRTSDKLFKPEGITHPGMMTDIRNYEPTDFRAYVEFYNAAESKNPDFRKLSADEIRSYTFDSPEYDSSNHFIALDRGRVVGSCRGVFSHQRARVKGPEAYLEFYMLHDRLEAATEMILFNKICENLRSKGAEWIATRADTRYTEYVSLLKRLGFSRTEYENHGMEYDPRNVKEPSVPHGYRIRVARIPEEVETMVRVFNEAFATRDKYPPQTLERFRKSWVFNEGSDQSGMFLAVRKSDNEVVGMVISAINRKFNKEHGVKRGGTYSLAVIPSERRKGIGTCLTLKSMRWIGDKGLDVAYVSVNVANGDALRIYQSLGYRTVQVYQGYRRDII